MNPTLTDPITTFAHHPFLGIASGAIGVLLQALHADRRVPDVIPASVGALLATLLYAWLYGGPAAWSGEPMLAWLDRVSGWLLVFPAITKAVSWVPAMRSNSRGAKSPTGGSHANPSPSAPASPVAAAAPAAGSQ